MKGQGKSVLLMAFTALASVIGLLFGGLLGIWPADAWAAIELGTGNKPVAELGALVLGGIGIFLVGIHFAGEHFQQMTGSGFREKVTNVSERGIGELFAGLFLGFFTQSGKAVAFILAGFVQANLLKVRESGPIIFWGNVGSSLIIFLSMLTIKVFALIVLGVTALGLTFRAPRKLVHAHGALFGIAMIMYGLFLVKEGAGGFAGSAWVHTVLEGMAGLYLPAFLAGMLLTVLIQSNIAMVLIAVALASAGLLSLEEAAMSIYGVQAGTGILTYIFSSNVHGRARQVVMGQVAFDAITTTVFFLIFFVESFSGLPLVLTLARTVVGDPGGQVIVLALGFQLAGALILLTVRKPVYDFIEQRFPPSTAEILSATEFLHDRAAESPSTALLLLEKEQSRLLGRLPAYIDFARPETDRAGLPSPADYHDAFGSINQTISATFSAMSRRRLATEVSERLIQVAKSQEQLVSLEGYVYQLVSHFSTVDHGGKAEELGRNILESVDFMILTAIDAIESKDSGEVETLEQLTQDRTEMMKRLRQNYFASERQMTETERNFVLDVTMLLENVVQTLARYGGLLESEAGAPG